MLVLMRKSFAKDAWILHTSTLSRSSVRVVVSRQNRRVEEWEGVAVDETTRQSPKKQSPPIARGAGRAGQ